MPTATKAEMDNLNEHRSVVTALISQRDSQYHNKRIGQLLEERAALDAQIAQLEQDRDRLPELIAEAERKLKKARMDTNPQVMALRKAAEQYHKALEIQERIEASNGESD